MRPNLQIKGKHELAHSRSSVGNMDIGDTVSVRNYTGVQKW